MKNKLSLLSLTILLGLTGCTFSMPSFIQDQNNEGEKDKPSEEPNDKTYKVCFYQDENLKSSQDVLAGSNIYDEPHIELISDQYYTYTFLGWDSNNDGVKETFPYVVNCDTNFTLLYSKTPVVYHYDIYVNNELKKSVDASYNDVIDYPEVASYWDGETPYIFVGWKYDGKYDGLKRLNVSKSCRIDAVFTSTQLVILHCGSQICAAYLEANTNVDIAKLFPYISVEDGKTLKLYTDEYYQSSYTPGKMVSGNLHIYAREALITEVSTPKYIDNINNLLFEFNCMILNRVSSNKFIINIDKSLTEIMNYFNQNSTSYYSYSYSAGILANELTINMEFEEVATTKMQTVDYTQVDSFNVQPYSQVRSNTFDAFKYKQKTTEFYVNTSDALYYALENGFKPVLNGENAELISLFNKMKTVLRNNVDDSMSDIEKARRIYEYLVLNTTYDHQVTFVSEGTAKYNSFYLEGVFNDNLAVCDGISKAYSCLCNMEGIECVRITGKTKNNVGHAWNKIKIDNKYYVVDATAAGTISDNKEYFNYSFFMITDSLYSQHANEYENLYSAYVADTSYDIYDNLPITIADKNCTLKATTRQEAANLLSYFNDGRDKTKNMSFDIELSYSYTTLSQEISEIQSLAGFSGTITYLPGLKGVTIIL